MFGKIPSQELWGILQTCDLREQKETQLLSFCHQDQSVSTCLICGAEFCVVLGGCALLAMQMNSKCCDFANKFFAAFDSNAQHNFLISGLQDTEHIVENMYGASAWCISSKLHGKKRCENATCPNFQHFTCLPVRSVCMLWFFFHVAKALDSSTMQIRIQY